MRGRQCREQFGPVGSRTFFCLLNEGHKGDHEYSQDAMLGYISEQQAELEQLKEALDLETKGRYSKLMLDAADAIAENRYNKFEMEQQRRVIKEADKMRRHFDADGKAEWALVGEYDMARSEIGNTNQGEEK